MRAENLIYYINNGCHITDICTIIPGLYDIRTPYVFYPLSGYRVQSGKIPPNRLKYMVFSRSQGLCLPAGSSLMGVNILESRINRHFRPAAKSQLRCGEIVGRGVNLTTSEEAS